MILKDKQMFQIIKKLKSNIIEKNKEQDQKLNTLFTINKNTKEINLNRDNLINILMQKNEQLQKKLNNFIKEFKEENNQKNNLINFLIQKNKQLQNNINNLIIEDQKLKGILNNQFNIIDLLKQKNEQLQIVLNNQNILINKTTQKFNDSIKELKQKNKKELQNNINEQNIFNKKQEDSITLLNNEIQTLKDKNKLINTIIQKKINDSTNVIKQNNEQIQNRLNNQIEELKDKNQELRLQLENTKKYYMIFYRSKNSNEQWKEYNKQYYLTKQEAQYNSPIKYLSKEWISNNQIKINTIFLKK